MDMRQTQRLPVCIRILVGLWAMGSMLGFETPAVAEGTPANLTNTLVGEQALAFQGGYILAQEQVSGTVIGAREAKPLLAGGEVLYVRFTPDADFKMGDRLTLYKPTSPVYHPFTGAFMGHLIAILGIVEITTTPENRVSKARIVRSFDSISPGNFVMPYKLPPPVPEQSNADGSLSGAILEFKRPQQLTAQGDIVYIDRGAADGVAIGDLFNVIRPGKQGPLAIRLPDEKIAELRIIGMQDRTATAMVIMSVDALRRGDIVLQLPSAAKATPEQQAIEAPSKTPVPAPRELAEIYFEFDKWMLSDKAKQDLAENAELLKQNAAAMIIIEGHADERGSREYNLALGEKRAQEVRRFLADLGISNELKVISYGKDRPACTEQDENCHSKNRRTHLVVESK